MASGAPSASPAFGPLIWVLFVAAQAADGVFTHVGIELFGIGIEANPIIAWAAAAASPATAVWGAKLFAVAAAMLLYVHGRHRTLGLLTIWYLALAIWPWTLVLWP